jgi:putative transcriptional regulator
MSTITLRLHELLRQREERENRRIRLAEITQATGISPNTLTPMLNNQSDRVSLEALAKLCSYFGCTPADLMRYSEQADEGEDAIDARQIVNRWEQDYGADEHPPER